MALRSLARPAALAAALSFVAATAQAQTFLSQSYDLQNGVPGQQVGYLTFEVVTGGTFRFYTKAPSHDGVLYLFEGAQGSLGSVIDGNDDACDFALCGPSAWANAFFAEALSPGVYTLAGSDYAFYEPEARSGINELRTNGTFTIVMDSEEGIARSVSTVPEPATVALMGTGLLGVAGIGARRRRRAQG